MQFVEIDSAAVDRLMEGLNTTECGVLWKLFTRWLLNEGDLPDDHVYLARAAGIPLWAYKRIADKMQERIVQFPDVVAR